MNTDETRIQIEQLNGKLLNSTNSYPKPIRVNQWLNLFLKKLRLISKVRNVSLLLITLACEKLPKSIYCATFPHKNQVGWDKKGGLFIGFAKINLW